jgi:hypothetical protein
MKIIITEEQLKTLVFQKAVDMAWQDVNDNVKEEDYYLDGGFGDNIDSITKIDVVTAYKNKNIIELGLIFYIDSIFDSIDVGDYLYELEYNLRKILGKENFKIILLNVINTNTNKEW